MTAYVLLWVFFSVVNGNMVFNQTETVSAEASTSDAIWSKKGRQEVASQIELLLNEFRSGVEAVRVANITCRYRRTLRCRRCVEELCEQRAQDVGCNSVSKRLRTAIESVCHFSLSVWRRDNSRTLQMNGDQCRAMTQGVINTVSEMGERLSMFDSFVTESLIPVLSASGHEFLSEVTSLTSDLSDLLEDLRNSEVANFTAEIVKETWEEVDNGVQNFGQSVQDFFHRHFGDVHQRVRQHFSKLSRQIDQAFSGLFGSSQRSRRQTLHEIEPNCYQIYRRPVSSCMVYTDHCGPCQPRRDVEVCPHLEETEMNLEKIELKLACLRAVEQDNWKYAVLQGSLLRNGENQDLALVTLFGKRAVIPLRANENAQELGAAALAAYLDSCTSAAYSALDGRGNQ